MNIYVYIFSFLYLENDDQCIGSYILVLREGVKVDTYFDFFKGKIGFDQSCSL